MRKFMINVNGNEYEVDVEEVTAGGSRPARAQAAPQPKAAAKPAAKPASKPAAKPAEAKKEVVVSAGAEIVESPMPGSIFKIEVAEGDTVQSGDVLLILEAMKMENEILAPKDGVVASINTTLGAAVNTGDKLVVIE